MEEVKGGYIENLILVETITYKNLFQNPLSRFPERKRVSLENVLRIICCKVLFGAPLESCETPEKIYFEGGLGYAVKQLRELGVGEEELMQNIFENRDKFLKTKDLLGADYSIVLKKKQCLETYNAIYRGLINLLSSQEVNQNSRQHQAAH